MSYYITGDMMKSETKIKLILVAFLLVLTAISLFMKYVEKVVMPRGAEVLHSYAETNMFEILNSSITDVLDSYGKEAENIVDVKYTQNGEIASVEVNYILANNIKSDVSMLISKKLSEQDEIPVYVPLGTFTQNMYMMGKGPKIKFILMQRGCIQTDFEEELHTAGVNQTMHSLKIKMEADVALMLPFYTTSTHIETGAILSQIIINGEIPSQYLSLGE